MDPDGSRQRNMRLSKSYKNLSLCISRISYDCPCGDNLADIKIMPSKGTE
jgi:hypothetical protein